jgi:hypothetical protein
MSVHVRGRAPLSLGVLRLLAAQVELNRGEAGLIAREDTLVLLCHPCLLGHLCRWTDERIFDHASCKHLNDAEGWKYSDDGHDG